MKFSDIFNIRFDDIVWTLRFGKPKRKGVIYDLRQEGFKSIDSPVFFLSTGRCGTKWFARLISADKKLKVFHEPQPNLGSQSKLAFETIIQKDFNINHEEARLIEEIFLAGREQYLRYSYKTEKRYIETNNHITFFAPVIAKLLPQALFVHVYRHPGEFVRSAIRRKYYLEGNKEDLKRIHPLINSAAYDHWDQWDQVRKNAWLWDETNQFIEKFKSMIPEDRIFSFNFNVLNFENVQALLNFIRADISAGSIRKLLGKKENIQKSGKYKTYSDWDISEKSKLKELCSRLAEKYNYQL